MTMRVRSSGELAGLSNRRGRVRFPRPRPSRAAAFGRCLAIGVILAVGIGGRPFGGSWAFVRGRA